MTCRRCRSLLTKAGSAAVAMLLAAACAPAASPSPSPGASLGASPTGGESPSPAAERTLVFADAGEPSTIDPAIANINWELTITRNVYDHLTTYNSNDPGTILPALATEWTNDGANLWTFKLRQGVKFHDGSDFTAEDVKATIDRMLKIGQGQAYLISSVKEVRVVDDYTVQIETASPDAFLAANLTHIEIVSADDVAAHASDDGKAWFGEHANGTGPYKFVSWERGSQITLQRNGDWWGTFPTNPADRVIVRFVGEGSTRARGLEGGEYDLANFVPLDEALRIGKLPGFSTVIDDNLWAWPAIYLNTQMAPTDSVEFRRALVLAYDYGAMLDYYQGLAETPRGPIPHWFPGSPENDLAPIARNLDAARAALEASGHAGATIKCAVPSGFPEFDFAATVLQSSAQEIGVTVQIEQLPFVQAIEAIKNDQAQCFVLGNANLSPTDATKFFDAHYVTGGFYNSSKYSNPEFDALVGRIRSEFDPNRRYELLKQASQMIVDTHMIIWAARPKTVVPIPDHVTGYVMDPAEYINARFYELSINR
jgi:peptide/nickel transport system substrate-binding protein